MKKEVYKIGDRVTIINPMMFVRCGYTLNKEEGKKLITEEQKRKICEVIGVNYLVNDGRLEPYLKGELVYFYDNPKANKAYEGMLDVLAYYIISSKSFGGPERKVFTEYKQDYLNREGYVVDKKLVKTGYYNHGDYGEEPEPPYLTDEKTHIILTVDLNYEEENFEFEPGEKIEEIHVKKTEVLKEVLV